MSLRSKKVLIDKIKDLSKGNLSQKQVWQIIGSLSDLLSAKLGEEQLVTLRGFGTFRSKLSGRMGKEGSANTLVKFKVAKAILNQYKSTKTSSPLLFPKQPDLPRKNNSTSNKSGGTSIGSKLKSQRDVFNKPLTLAKFPKIITTSNDKNIFEIKHVSQLLGSRSYDFSLNDISTLFRDGFYPKIILPTNTNVYSHLNSKGGKKGLVEFNFYDVVKNHISELSIDTAFNREDLPCLAFPDLLYRLEQALLYINIEIDEPYIGADRKPIHFNDTVRDRKLADSGWLVLRFTERQVYQQPFAVLQFLQLLLIKLGVTTITLPYDCEALTNDKCWTYEGSLKLADENYRESYLGVEFEQVLGYETIVTVGGQGNIRKPTKLNDFGQLFYDVIANQSSCEVAISGYDYSFVGKITKFNDMFCIQDSNFGRIPFNYSDLHYLTIGDNTAEITKILAECNFAHHLLEEAITAGLLCKMNYTNGSGISSTRILSHIHNKTYLIKDFVLMELLTDKSRFFTILTETTPHFNPFLELKLSFDTGEYIYAYCFNNKEFRTFRKDRILNIEVLPNHSLQWNNESNFFRTLQSFYFRLMITAWYEHHSEEQYRLYYNHINNYLFGVSVCDTFSFLIRLIDSIKEGNILLDYGSVFSFLIKEKLNIEYWPLLPVWVEGYECSQLVELKAIFESINNDNIIAT